MAFQNVGVGMRGVIRVPLPDACPEEQQHAAAAAIVATLLATIEVVTGARTDFSMETFDPASFVIQELQRRGVVDAALQKRISANVPTEFANFTANLRSTLECAPAAVPAVRTRHYADGTQDTTDCQYFPHYLSVLRVPDQAENPPKAGVAITQTTLTRAGESEPIITDTVTAPETATHFAPGI